MPDLLAGLGMLALVALVLWVAPANRVHRAFALLVVLMASESFGFVGRVGFAETDPLLATALENWNRYLSLAWPFAAGFFALRFFDSEGRARASRPIAWSLLVGVVVVLSAFAIDHSVYTYYGPLGLLWHARPLVHALMGLLFLVAARRAEAPARRDGLVLGSLAFTLLGAFWSAVRATMAPAAPADASAVHPAMALLPWALPSLGVLAVLATVGLAFVAPPLRGDGATRRSRRLLATGAASSGLVGIAAPRLALLDPVAFALAPNVLDGVLRVAMTALLAYALLRRQVFDVEVRLRFAISRSTVAAVFIAVFFVASEAAQQFFGESTGSTYAGIVAAGALVFAIAPLQRAAERLAEKAVPASGAARAEVHRSDAARGEESYLKAVRLAARDRRLTRDEELQLHELARDLGIDGARAHAILVQVESEHDAGAR